MIYLYYVFMSMFRTGWGCAFLIIFATLLACCAMGVVDFVKKPKKLEPDRADEDLAETQEKINQYLAAELQGSFEVSHFDGAFQIFTTPDQEISDQDLYQKLQTKFPRRAFGFHRTLHNIDDASSVA